MTTAFGRIGDEVAAFLLAANCAGCDVPATLLCEGCRAQLRPDPITRTTPGGLRVTSALPFEGVPARVIRALKQEGATYLARPLGRSLRAVLSEYATARISPLPTSWSSFRSRGYRVPELLVRRAGYVPERLLVPGRAVSDQRGLGHEERYANVRGSIRMRRAARPASRVVLVDDVVTSGATLDEAQRVCAASGIDVLGAVTLAATPRLRPI